MAYEEQGMPRQIGVDTNFLKQGTGYSYGSTRRVTNLTMAGQNGLSPDLRYIVGNAAHVSRNVDCILLEAPRAFYYLPDGEVWIASLKSLVEEQVETIDGLNKSLHVEFVQTQVGASEIQDDVARVSRDRSEVSMKWTDHKGMPINRFFEQWIILLFGHPDNQVPGIMAIDDNGNTKLANFKKHFAHLPDLIGMTCLFYETDETKMRIQKSWLITNMMPDGAGDVTGRKDLTAAGEKLEITVKFTGVQQVGDGVDVFAQKILNNLDRSGVNTNTRRAFFDMDDNTKVIQNLVQQAKMYQIPEGSDLAKPLGYYNQAKDIGKNGTETYLNKTTSNVEPHKGIVPQFDPTTIGTIQVSNPGK